MDDFSKQKIVWARLMRITKNDINNFPRFSIVPSGYYTVDSLCFFTGNDLQYLMRVLNSEFAAYYFMCNIVSLDNGGFQMRQQFVEQFPIPNIKKEVSNNQDIYDLYDFNTVEREYIHNIVASRLNEIATI